MAEPSVQVPVSLIREVTAALGFHVGEQDDLYRRVDALLSQPTPSAETVSPLCLYGHDALSAGGHCRRCGVQVVDPSGQAAAPPSMVPGTTFTAAVSEAVWRWAVREDGLIVSGLGVGRMSAIDPSTIRDVTPPKETP